MLKWDLGQYQVAGQHVLSYGAGLATMAAAWGVATQVDAASLTEHLTDIYNGSLLLAKGLAGLATTAGSIYAGYRAVKAASPSQQIKTVVANLQAPPSVQAANAIADPDSRKDLIAAVSKMPEVKAIVSTPEIAQATPEAPKVVASVPNDLRG